MELAVSGPQAVKNNLAANHRPIGGVLEWSNRPVLKTGVVKATVGSNPTPSAINSTTQNIHKQVEYTAHTLTDR